MQELMAFLEILPISQVREMQRTVEDLISKQPDNAVYWAYRNAIRQVLGFDE